MSVPVMTRPAAAAASGPGPSAAGGVAAVWSARPACAGLEPAVVFARRVKDAAPALRACARCTLHQACEAVVAPAETWFDGVCAGRLWRNGRAVAALDPVQPTPAPRSPGSARSDRATGSDEVAESSRSSRRELP